MTFFPLSPLGDRRRAAAAACAALCMAAAATPVRAADPAGAVPLGATVDTLLDQARHANPELAAMRHDADAAAERVQPAGALPDPMLRVELENMNNSGNDARPNVLPWKVGETKYTLLQTLPTAGKRGLRRDAATAAVDEAQARSAGAWNELAAKIKAAYAQYWGVVGNERITVEVADLLARVEQLAQARYAGGLVPQQDAIRAQIERTALRAELIALHMDKHHLTARLNAMLSRAADDPLADPQVLRPLPALSAFNAGALVERARANNPLLRAEEARVRAAQANRELALRNRYPDVAVGVSPVQMGSRIASWGVMVEVNIPLQQEARRSQERESDAMLAAARSRSQSVANQLLGELGENLSAIDAARRSDELIATQLLPQTELGLRSALAGYENGKVDFATLLEAQRQIRKARQDQLKLQVEAQMRLAEIERIVGEEL